MDRFERISKMVEIVEENCGRKLRRRRKRNVVTMPGQSVGRYDVGNSVQVAAAPLHPSPSHPETQTSGRSYELFQWVYRSYSLAVSWLPLALSNLRIYIKHEWSPPPPPPPPPPPLPPLPGRLSRENSHEPLKRAQRARWKRDEKVADTDSCTIVSQSVPFRFIGENNEGG